MESSYNVDLRSNTSDTAEFEREQGRRLIALYAWLISNFISFGLLATAIRVQPKRNYILILVFLVRRERTH